MKLRIVTIAYLLVMGACFLPGISVVEAANQDVSEVASLNTCKHGIHLLSPSDEDFKKAAELVNSQGGKNCWAVLVIRQDEMKTSYLQRIADLARENHIQLIYRIERGFDKNARWLMPNKQTTQTFIDALSGHGKASEDHDGTPFNPVTKDIYVVLGNEPTHAAMCGGCTPEQMADWTMESIRMLHAAGERLGFDIHVGMAAQDLASPHDPANGFYDAEIFMERMFTAQPDLLCEVDVWYSHNYPRSFVGSAFSSGRLSPYGYEWELAFARTQAKSECKNRVSQLPVFITETGYRVGSGGVDDDHAYAQSQYMIGKYVDDTQVKMFGFFADRYCGEPFEVFALRGCDGNGLNGVGRALYEAPKVEGEVRHIHKARTVLTCPDKLVEGIDVTCLVSAKNLGTDIWKDLDGDYQLRVVGKPKYSSARFSRFRAIKPDRTLTATMHYNPGDTLGKHDLTVGLEKNGELLLGLATWPVETYPAPTIELEAESILGRAVNAERAQIQVFDGIDDALLHKAEFDIVSGKAALGKIPHVGFDTCYRVVLLVDKNLPVQKDCVRFTVGTNYVKMPRLMAIDRNSDGKLSLGDILNKYEE